MDKTKKIDKNWTPPRGRELYPEAYRREITNPERRPKTAEQRRKAAEMIVAGAPISEALAANGWSERTARKGRRAVPKALLVEIAKLGGKRLAKIGKAGLDDPRAIEEVIVGRLIENVVKGEDDGVASAKQLGSHRAINCWQPDPASGAVTVNVAVLDSIDAGTVTTSGERFLEAGVPKTGYAETPHGRAEKKTTASE